MHLNTRLPKETSAQHQFVFFDETHLQETPTVRHLQRFVVPVRIADPCQSILDRFLDNSALYALPVINSLAQPVALIDRKHYIEFFSKPYSREIFGRRSFSELISYDGYENIEPIVVEERCSVEDVAQIIIDAGMQHMVTGFVVSREGCYLGVANGHDLLNIITRRRQDELY